MHDLLARINRFLDMEATLTGYSKPFVDNINDKPARELNNKIKQYLLNTHTQPHNHFLDLPCGSGNDIAKLTGIGIDRYVGIDLDCSDFLLNVARKRDAVRLMADKCRIFKADMCDGEMFSKLKLTTNTFDVVSCQFALHYSFESEKTANAFIHNVASALKTGGRFIATYPNGEALITKWRELAAAGKNVFESEHFKITFPEAEPVNEIGSGQKYHFQLGQYVDDYEFLVSDKRLKEICNANGLDLLTSMDFSELCASGMDGNNSFNTQLTDLKTSYAALSASNRELVNLYKYCVFLKQRI